MSVKLVAARTQLRPRRRFGLGVRSRLSADAFFLSTRCQLTNDEAPRGGRPSPDVTVIPVHVPPYILFNMAYHHIGQSWVSSGSLDSAELRGTSSRMPGVISTAEMSALPRPAGKRQASPVPIRQPSSPTAPLRRSRLRRRRDPSRPGKRPRRRRGGWRRRSSTSAAGLRCHVSPS